MAIDRTLLRKGPGFITYAGASIHSDTDITVVLVEEFTDAVTSGFARTGRKLKNRYVEVTATPSMWMNLDKLFPHASLQIGDVLIGATDTPLVVTPRNGRPITVLNACITQFANLKLSAESPAFKSAIKWTGLVANNSAAGVLANYFTQGAIGTAVALTGFDGTKRLRGRYTGTRNAVALRSDKGFDIDFALQLEPDQPDGEPIVNYRLKSLEASVKCVPVALLEADYLALLNDGVDIGGEPSAYDIVVAGPGVGFPTVTIANTYVEPGGFTYGEAYRNGELAFQSIRKITTNLLTPLFTISTLTE